MGTGMFPLWTFKASRHAIAEIIHDNHAVEYYLIDKKINNEFFIIKHIGIFHIIPKHAKILDGKVRIYQYPVESLNPVDPTVEKSIHAFCKKNKFREVLPVMMELSKGNPSKDGFTINEPLHPRAIEYLDNFKNAVPAYYLNLLVQQEQVHDESKKWRVGKVFPKIEAKVIFAILVGGAIAVAVIVSVMGNSGIDLGAITPKFLKGEFIAGIKLFTSNMIAGLKGLI